MTNCYHHSLLRGSEKVEPSDCILKCAVVEELGIRFLLNVNNHDLYMIYYRYQHNRPLRFITTFKNSVIH